MRPETMDFTQETGNWGAAKKFRLIIREQGEAREMGGNEMSLAVGIVDNIMMNALDLGASDIHLQPERDQLRIRFRQDGVLHDNGQLPPEQAANVIARLKLAASMRIDENREPQDGRIDMEYNGRRLSARASCVPSLNGEKFVMRLLDPSAMKVDLESLGMQPQTLEKWNEAIQVPYGLILVTGPTGSGKTSTLYASLNKLDSKTRNIVTVEDPIEYEFEHNIAQVQVTEKNPFPRVMRAFLRQDPDVMMVGEIRDPESLKIAIQAGLTGHLVVSTLHTNNALEAVGRMVDMGAEWYLISGVLVAVMAQRLVRRNCSQCSEPHPYSRDELEMIGITANDMTGATLMKGKGCPACRGTGFKGRIGIFELVTGNREFKQAITHKADYPELLAAARNQGFFTMIEDGRQKVLKGQTTPEEVAKAVLTQAID
ncbi:GspE/PulE family protein [Kamptonema cortianum]|nr:GspE/PulE family protein [Geitlerinema splendidum]MDK3156227.1 GspE/PulE family protein [Kamptonema cortianum]